MTRPEPGSRTFRQRACATHVRPVIFRLVCIVTVAAIAGCSRRAPELPVLATVPPFSLVSSEGSPVSDADLRGTVWIADFIFTQCPGVCPILSDRMAKLQHALRADGHSGVRLVSFTVDPANDTPEVLRAYAQRFHAEPPAWIFVTGQRRALFALIHDGFKLAMAERSPDEADDGQGLVTHSDRFALVDRQLRIRGYYRPTEAESFTQLVRDAAGLAATAD